MNTSSIFESTAVQIGQQLVETAVWDADRQMCNWMGGYDITDAKIAPYSSRRSALSPEFYSGSCGLAYFLAELYASTRKSEFLTTAAGGWQRSVRYMQTQEFPAPSISFYAGELGVLFVGLRMVEIAPELRTDFQPQLEWLKAQLPKGLDQEHSLDIIGGNSGAIPVLAELYRKTAEPVYAQVCKACAEEMVREAEWVGEKCIWSTAKIHGAELKSAPTTGYSHGASGMAVALLEAYQQFDDPSFLTHGRGAFAFENSLFSAREGNWVDTRSPHSFEGGEVKGTFRSAWCHGAPGIGLANLRASKLDPVAATDHLKYAQIAAATTRKRLELQLATNPDKDATLCHGVLGSCEVLLTIAEELNDAELWQYTSEKAAGYLKRFSKVEHLPSGLVRDGESPSIMVGLASVGMHCLRYFATEKFASPLLLVA